MPSGLGNGLLEIAMALISVAFVAMLVSRSSQTAQVVKSGSDAFSTLIMAATMNSKSGTFF